MADASQPPNDQSDPVDASIDRIAEAVVNKLEERRKIDAIAQAVLQRMNASQSGFGLSIGMWLMSIIWCSAGS